MKRPSLTVRFSSTPDWLPLLAAAVVQQAVVDAFDPSLPPSVRTEARQFLAGGADYRFWGEVAEGRRRN